MDKISIVVPCYNEKEAIPIFYTELNKIIPKLNTDYELIFIDDGSSDGTLKEIKELAKKDDKIKYISFSRNFGKESAMFAGLEAANGDYTAIMDADLQDPPELLIQMYDEIKSGEYDCIATRRATRKGEPPVRSFFAKMFYKLIN